MYKPKMICTECGAEMNHHGMKIDYNVHDPSMVDPIFNGLIQEAHTCPECGRTALREA